MVDLEIEDGFGAIVTIDRPHARNAISLETMDQFDEALDRARGARRTRDQRRRRPGVRFRRRSQGTQRAADRTRGGSAMARRMRSVCDRIASLRAGARRAERSRPRRRRRGGRRGRHPAGRRRRQVGFNQVALEIMPAWGGAERLAALVGKSQALLLAGTGTMLDGGGGRTRRIGSARRASRVVRGTSGARSPASWHRAPPGRSSGSSPVRHLRKEAVAAFARLWVSDEHWAAADKVMNRGKSITGRGCGSGRFRPRKHQTCRRAAKSVVAALIISTSDAPVDGPDLPTPTARLFSPTTCTGPLPMFSMISRATSSGSIWLCGVVLDTHPLQAPGCTSCPAVCSTRRHRAGAARPTSPRRSCAGTLSPPNTRRGSPSLPHRPATRRVRCRLGPAHASPFRSGGSTRWGRCSRA